MVATGMERLRGDMFLPVIDQICGQRKDRFSDDQMGLLSEMSLFSSGNLKQGSSITVNDIKQLTDIYNLDSLAIVNEYSDFCSAFSSLNIAHAPNQGIDSLYRHITDQKLSIEEHNREFEADKHDIDVSVMAPDDTDQFDDEAAENTRWNSNN